MSKVAVTKDKLDYLANAISAKSGESLTLTIDEMIEAVDGIETGGGEPNLQAKTYTVSAAGTDTIEADSGYDGLSEVEVSVPQANPSMGFLYGFFTDSGVKKWRARAEASFDDGETQGWMGTTKRGDYTVFNAVPSNTTITPTTSSQTIGGANYMMEGAVTVAAMPSGAFAGMKTLELEDASITIDSNGLIQSVSETYGTTNPVYQSGYIDSNTALNYYAISGGSLQLTKRTSSDLTASGATVTAPAGYYPSQATKTVASGTAGTPTATKGTVSNHSISVTPSVTNSAGYISGGTKTGTAVSVSASELVSGTYTVDSSGTKDVTNYASASVPSGTAGTPSASKGTVSNHSVTVTPSVTNQTGWITGSTKTGTAVTVSASELASGNKAITQNGTGIDVVGYSTVSVNVAGSEYTRTVIAPQQTVSSSSAMQQITLTSSGLIEDAKSYIVTLDNVEWLTTCETLWTANYCIGDVRYFLEASPSNTIYPFGAICESGTIYVCFSATGSHTIKIERLDFVTDGTTLTTKTITQNGTYNASTDSADGYSSVTVNVGGSSPTIQSLTVNPSTTQQTFNASGVDGYKPVTVSAVSQTNLTAENIKNGTTVTISNGTSNIYSVTGTYSGGGGTSKNVQVLQSTSRTNSSSLTKVLGDLTVSKTGTYDVYWSGGRTNTSTSYTWGTRLYIDGSGYGTENTSWSNNCQSNHLSNVSLTANQKLSVYARGRTGSYYTFAPMLVIVEA